MLYRLSMSFKKGDWKRAFSTNTIEIEKKFICTPSVLHYCLQNSITSVDIKMTDTYYDNSSFTLSKKDMWLRRRNGKLELKWPQQKENNQKQDSSGTDFYLESTDVNEISKIIKEKTAVLLTPTDETNYSWLQRGNISTFGVIRSLRRRHFLNVHLEKYPTVTRNDPSFQRNYQAVFVDIDNVIFFPAHIFGEDDDHSYFLDETKECDAAYKYVIGEIEFCNDNELATLSRSDQVDIMRQVFETIGIDGSKPVRGKVLEYLYRFSPEHYQALEDCGQLQSKGIPKR